MSPPRSPVPRPGSAPRKRGPGHRLRRGRRSRRATAARAPGTSTITVSLGDSKARLAVAVVPCPLVVDLPPLRWCLPRSPPATRTSPCNRLLRLAARPPAQVKSFWGLPREVRAASLGGSQSSIAGDQTAAALVIVGEASPGCTSARRTAHATASSHRPRPAHRALRHADPASPVAATRRAAVVSPGCARPAPCCYPGACWPESRLPSRF